MSGWRSAFRVRFTALVLVGAGVLLSGLVGCGEDEPSSPGEAAGSGEASDPEAGWGDHAGGETAAGSPDGAGGAGSGVDDTSREGLLATLRARVAEGRGMADAAYQHEVRDVAEVLWPVDGSPEERAGAQVHMQVAAIAAQVGGWFAAEEAARAERTASDPVDVKIHAAFLKASAAGPDAYRVWCSGEGAVLLKELAAARHARFFPKKK